MNNCHDLQEELQRKIIEILDLRKLLEIKEEKISDLTSQLDKYRSIFKNQLTTRKTNLSVNSINDHRTRSRGLGISAEPRTNQILNDVELIKIPKSQESETLIRKAILDNEFMRNLHSSQIQSIIDCMKPVTFPAQSLIIKEGDIGSMVYVLEDGILTVSKNGKFLRDIVKETTFGELAILYDCTRTATITAAVQCRLWSIDRQSFQTIMMKTGLMKQSEHLELLKIVPNFQSIPEDKLEKIAEVLEEITYDNDQYIIRQGGRGDTFYIIANGRVRVTKVDKSGDTEKFIRYMERGEWFGEKALINEDVRTANIIADHIDGVRCLVLDRESYLHLIGSNNLQRIYPDDTDILNDSLELLIKLSLIIIYFFRNTFNWLTDKWAKSELSDGGSFQFEVVSINDLEKIATIGIGGFGKVELVRLKSDEFKSFALKKMRIKHIIRTRQKDHVMNEKTILSQIHFPFIVELYKTFKDFKYLYMLMEVCLGGELWSILRDKVRFDENTTRFYIASVVEAFSYLHGKSIVYRDLKPENILLDNTGYIKLTDFGFAKKVRCGRKTWTFCGTPEYVAPEIILNKGHDHGADLWSLGILIYELLTGIPPFYANDPMKVYNLILKGIDTVHFERTSRNSQNLIKKLCRDNPIERLGYGGEGIKMCQKHIWFESFCWEGIISKTLHAPIIPNILSPLDHSNFDHYTEESDIESENDDNTWDINF